MGNPGNETDRRNLHINRRDSRSTHARGSLLKSSAKAEKIKRIFEFCQHRQERAQSLSPSKLEALDCLLFKIIVTSLLFLFVWGSHCIACQATGAARQSRVSVFSARPFFLSIFSLDHFYCYIFTSTDSSPTPFALKPMFNGFAISGIVLFSSRTSIF